MSAPVLTPKESSGALLSADGFYRYRLWRIWDLDAPIMVWVLLNPSTADAATDDPTLRKCIGFAKRHGHGGVILVNLFAWRSTDPKMLIRQADPIGPENDGHIDWAMHWPILATTVAAWGKPGNSFITRRATTVSGMLSVARPPQCFGLTKDGHPRHPLYLPYESALVPLKESR